MKRLIVYLFPFFIAGILFSNNYNFFYFSAVLSALFLTFYVKKEKTLVIFCLIFFVIGMTAAFIHNAIYDRKYSMLKSLNIYRGYIIEKYNSSYIVKNYNNSYKIILKVYDNTDIEPGDFIEFEGEIKEKPSYRKKIMNSSNIDAYISCYNHEINKLNTKTLLMIPIKLKYKIINRLLSIDKTGGGFMCSLLFGYDNVMQYDDIKNFKELGIAHILAVSGFNIGIVYYFIRLITKNIPANLRYLLSIFSCFMYTFLSGFEPSIIRAFLMIVLIIFSKLINRMNDPLTVLTVAGYIMLVYNSFYIYNIGFILSFSATYGIIIFKEKLKDNLLKEIRIIKDEIAVSVSSFITTFPIIIWYNGYISIISIIVNIIISPFAAFLTIFGFAAVCFYSVTNFDLILYPAAFFSEVFINIINIFNKYNYVLVTGRPSAFFVFIYYGFLLLLFGIVRFKIKKVFLYFIETILIAVIFYDLFYYSHALKVHFINVGQGDSIFIETPDRKSILIDTGPQFADYVAARDKIIPYIFKCGYRKIDILILTHLHSDHAGGLDFIFKNFAVDKIVTYKKPEGTNYKFIELMSGDRIKIQDVILDILYPEKKNLESTNGNETCLVINLKYKNFSMLLASDAEKAVMDNISGKFDIVKIPHHGSIESFSLKMLENSKITNAIISVGKNNFGHPSEKLINELKKRGIEVFRTDENGNIIIETKGFNYSLKFDNI